MRFSDDKDPRYTEKQRMGMLKGWAIGRDFVGGGRILGDGSEIFEGGRWLPMAMLRLEDRDYVREVLDNE
jgi:hypothetical protein